MEVVKGAELENYVTAAGWYLFGIGVYFVYMVFIHRSLKEWVDLIHEEVPEFPFSDGVIKTVIIVVGLLIAFVWPISMVGDFIGKMKGDKAQ